MKKKASPPKSSKKPAVVKSKAKSKYVKQKAKKTTSKPGKKKVVRVKKDESDVLVETVIKAIQDKKGENIVSINLKKINAAVCSYFVICEANSRTQVSAIAESVEEIVKKDIGQKPYHTEGYQNAEWILIDYVDVVVHVFQRSIRALYRLEDLWADGEMKHYD